ncbi:alpha/beta hydrolase [uncultured Roseivirga sp.]|uniref:alpha/beta fold hydrolase n=1 Tax=uncultured Roseivirga sp. TaxID=543088 RepID=UPI0030DBCC81|tara:strand:- start:2350 stop:3036 length:687 start_codon:yes stop_codon:yes gene_type:complete
MKKLILLHGALGSASMFDGLTEKLKGNFEVYAFNFSGHGGGPINEEGFGIEVFAEELKAFIINNKLEKADIFGYSMGGYVALYLAASQPNLIGKIVTLGTKLAWTAEGAEEETARLNPELIKEKVPKYAALLKERHGKKQWKQVIWQTAGMMLELGDEPLLTMENLPLVTNEVTILLGADDIMVSKEESENVATILTNGKFISIPNMPHPLEKLDMGILCENLKSILI